MKFIAYDLGTGGVKASLYDQDLKTIAKSFIEYKTFYPRTYMHEQKPDDWWQGIIDSTQLLLKKSGTSGSEIHAVALSGHSCVAIPMDKEGNELLQQVPIWSDTRAAEETECFFDKINRDDWYLSTGNGFPPSCYSIFKLMWYKNHEPEVFGRIDKVLGSKDYINYRLTGAYFTDFSYISSSGVYNLLDRNLNKDFLEAAGIPESFFPPIVPSHYQIGTVTPEAARLTGLGENTVVACGGVDNACMALGAIGTAEGSIYTSLGSSSWVPVNSRKPVLDPVKKPYVFAHIDETMFTSAFSIFAGGSSFRWIRETLCKDLDPEDIYNTMSALADQIPVGSGGLIFNPSLAGGTSQDKSVHIRGAFLGLNLSTTRDHMIRAAMEGIAMNLKISIDYLAEHTNITDEILFCGGGSKSDIWMQMFADIFNMRIVKTNIDQDAASLGAAAICAKSTGLWEDYRKIKELHEVDKIFLPDSSRVPKYERLSQIFVHTCNVLSTLGDYMNAADLEA